jgi:hypothetical protein
VEKFTLVCLCARTCKRLDPACDRPAGTCHKRLRPVPLRHVGLGRHRSFGAVMTDHEQALRAARDSLRNVVSIRDFLLAVQVGSETAVAMLDKTESRLLEVLETLNEDYGR